MTKNTLVIGASTNPERYSYKAMVMLSEAKEVTYAFGLKLGQVAGIDIVKDWSLIQNLIIDTVTMYIGAARQSELEAKLLALKPNRIIFNPGTENPDFQEKAKVAGIEIIEACTLVMISTNQY